MESFILDPTTTALAWFQAFLLVFLRCSGIFERLPVLGAAMVPRQVKVWLSFFLAIVLFPVAMSFQTTPLMPQSLGVFLVACAMELGLGLLIGFMGALLLTGFQLAGRLMDDQMGFSLANVFDPTTGESVSVTSQLVFYVGVLCFVALGGIEELLLIFGWSFEMVPLLTFSMSNDLGRYILTEAFPQTLVLAVTLAAPTIIVVTMATVALGLLGKVVPEMNIFSFSFGIRVFLGLIMVQLSITHFSGFVQTVVSLGTEQVRTTIGTIAGG